MPFQASNVAPASRRSYMQARPLRMMRPRGGGAVGRGNRELAGLDEERGRREPEREAAPSSRHRRGNWVFKILRVGSISAVEDGKRGRRSGGGANDNRMIDDRERCSSCCPAEISDGGCQVSGSEGTVKLDRESFRGMLRRVSLPEAKLFGRLSYLGRLAYNIPRIKVTR